MPQTTRSICENYLGGHSLYYSEGHTWEVGHGLVEWFFCEREFCDYRGFREIEPQSDRDRKLVDANAMRPPSSSAMSFTMKFVDDD